MTKVERIIAKELEEAELKAKLEGKLEGKLELAKQLLDVLSPQLIAEKTGLPLEEILKLK